MYRPIYRKKRRKFPKFLVILVLLAAAVFSLTYLHPPAPEPDTWSLLLVNGSHPLPAGYQPELTYLSNGQAVDTRIYPDLQQMFDTARAEGIYPTVVSGYRTQEKQQSIMDEQIAAYVADGYPDILAKSLAEDTIARPGTSEHQLGLSVDINADPAYSTDEAVYRWLAEHAWRFGFILRYPQDKTAQTGISYEPWHYRYVGREAAAEIYQRECCLEEYLS